jgi:hypothetical protein
MMYLYSTQLVNIILKEKEWIRRWLLNCSQVFLIVSGSSWPSIWIAQLINLDSIGGVCIIG